MAYLGFILRRRTAPDAPKLFELFASLLLRDAPPPSPDGRALPRGAESGEDCS
jgi:hypothetical protein